MDDIYMEEIDRTTSDDTQNGPLQISQRPFLSTSSYLHPFSLDPSKDKHVHCGICSENDTCSMFQLAHLKSMPKGCEGREGRYILSGKLMESRSTVLILVSVFGHVH